MAERVAEMHANPPDPNSVYKHPILKYLIRIDLDLSGLCNKQCTFCPRSLTHKPTYPNINKHMSLETVEIVLKELRAIDFAGWFELAGRGESTLHKHFYEVVDMVTAQPRKWRVRLTTNGHKIDEWWPRVAHKLDDLYLNSYDSLEQYKERLEKYPKLPRGQLIQHFYKQDGLTVEEINKMPPHQENDGVWYNYAFNNRAGWFSNQYVKEPCWHPMRQIFIDYEGNYQMCCNDWTYQIKIGNIHERGLIDMYVNDPKVNRIRWQLLNNNRQNIKPCSMCTDTQGRSKGVTKLIQHFRTTDVYKFHVCKKSAGEGKSYDEDLLNGK